MKVLLVDDNREDRKNYTKFIGSARQNVEVIVAYDALDAKAKLAELVPEMAIINLFLPNEESGLDLVREMRANRRTASVRIFGLTTSDSDGTEDRARDAGCEDCFVKQRDVDRLIDVIRRAPYV